MNVKRFTKPFYIVDETMLQRWALCNKVANKSEKSLVKVWKSNDIE